MNCPKCGETMLKGDVQVRGTFWEFLFVGLSSQHLFFSPDEGKRQRVMESADVHHAHQCESCGCVLVEPEKKGWWK